MNNQTRGRLITLEGIEGVGKSTIAKFLKEYLEQLNIPVLGTREPGGTPVAEAIRNILLAHHSESIFVDTELLLLFAGRAQHLATMIRPALACGTWVLCDRFTDASFAYQGGGRQIAAERIAYLEQWVHGDLQPDLTLLMVSPVEVALRRAGRRGHADRFESEQSEFFARVQEAYLERAAQYPERFRIIDASVSLKIVQQEIQRVVDLFIASY